jgi:hypothetical protein
LPPPTSAAWPWSSRGAAISATKRWILIALLAGACAVYFVALGNSAIWDANEAFYVETPREMLEAHDFLNPTFNYLPRFNKPVLSYWIVAGSTRRSASRSRRSASHRRRRADHHRCAFVSARSRWRDRTADSDRIGDRTRPRSGPRPAWRRRRGW